MGFGSQDNKKQVKDYYDTHTHITAAASGDVEKIYSSSIFPEMDPEQTKLPREACDSPLCPRSRGVMIIFDDTSSMNRLLTDLVQNQMKRIAVEVPNSVSYDPQILFGCVNDIRARCTCPLQIGQFEAGFNEMIQQITSLHIQGGGGGNGSESYIIPQYFAAKYTRLESLEKRGEKGILFVIGDDGPTPSFTQVEREVTFGKNNIQGIRGTLSAEDVLEMAEEKFHVYQIIVHGGTYYSGMLDNWRQLLKGHALDISDTSCIPDLVIAVMRMYDGMTKSEAIAQISDSYIRNIVASAMHYHEEVAEPEGVPTAMATEIEDF